MADYGKDLTKPKMALSHAQGVCPRCGANAIDMRGTSASQFTLRSRGRCFWEGELHMGFECNNKGARDKAT